MKPSLRTVLSLFALLSVLGMACGREEGAPGGAFFDIKIGGVLPLTGDLSDFGPAMARAGELAGEVFEEAARAAGQDISVEILVEDSQTDAAAGVEAARKLVDTERVHAIVGAAASAVTIAVAESVTIPNRIAQCSPASTSGDITTLADDGFVNRTPPSDEHQAPILAELVRDELGADATVNLGARNDAYGNFLINGVEEELRARGLTIGPKVLWDTEAPTFDSEAGRIVSGDPDGWVLVDFPGTWQKMGPALVRTGAWDSAKTFSADGLKTSKVPQDPPIGAGRQSTEGMRGTAPGGTEAFNALWEEEVTDLGRETFDAHTFDCTILVLLAAVKAGSNDSTAIKDNLRDVSGPGGPKYTFEDLEQAIRDLADGEDIDYEGASGPIDLDENGDVRSIDAVYEIYQFRNQEMVVVGTQRVAA